MARRGKAANRNARRKAQRSTAQRRPPAGPAAAAPAVDAGSSSGAMPDAFEIADAEVRAAALPPLATGTTRAKPRAADQRVAVGSSRLNERAVAEYHYVQRDLRNIAVLAIILAALLAVATILVNVTGLI
ncbi:MAG TPA: hypothetical protein VIH19_04710 [Candidatus Limnocylindria bacterium]|jgi:hypothetical protein